jgi:hypothetical protein
VKYFSLILALCAVVTAGFARADSDDWRKQVSTAPAGSFPALPNLRMHFAFGWSNVLKAAEADATIQGKGAEYRANVSGKTEGVARTLWPLDAQQSATIQASPPRPKRMVQIERYRTRTIQTQLRFDASGLDRLRSTSNSKKPERWKRVDFEPIHDVVSAILYVRSQPLRIGDEVGVVCFPGDSPYLGVVKVEKREMIRSMGKTVPALRLSLTVRQLEVEKKKPTKSVPYAKFHSGTIWVSDDALRIPLRAEVSVFVGFIYGELVSCEKL